MSKSLKIILCALTFSLLVSPLQAVAGGILRTLVHEGLERTYGVHVPPGRAQGDLLLPLVVVLHGANGNVDQIEAVSGMSDKADREGFIVVYPEGTGDPVERKYSWNAINCCGAAFREQADDVGFIKELLERLLKDYPIDSERIYVAGFSNGAMLTYRLACTLSDKIAAFAPVSGALYEENCRPSDPVSMILFHGTADRNILYRGGVSPEPGVAQNYDSPVSDTIQFWAQHDHARLVDEKEVDSDGLIIRQRYLNPKTGAEVVFFKLIGGGHEWPDRGSGLDATDEIWKFFKSHKKIRKSAR